MVRPLKKPDYDPEKILNEILYGVVQAYESLDQSQRLEGQLAHGALKDLSDELGFPPSKIKKLLITAAYVTTGKSIATGRVKQFSPCTGMVRAFQR